MESRTLPCIFCKKPVSSSGPMVRLICVECMSERTKEMKNKTAVPSVGGNGNVPEFQEDFPDGYKLRIRRVKSKKYGNSVTFIHLGAGRPRPLADDAYTELIQTKRHFEIPVFITNNKGKEFEGVLKGTADGRDITVVWEPDTSSDTLGVITETSNPTVTFEERRGAADNW